MSGELLVGKSDIERNVSDCFSLKQRCGRTNLARPEAQREVRLEVGREEVKERRLCTTAREIAASV
jgi:hypothetical protein